MTYLAYAVIALTPFVCYLLFRAAADHAYRLSQREQAWQDFTRRLK